MAIMHKKYLGLGLIFIFPACSWLDRGARAVIGEESNTQRNKRVKVTETSTVPREQFDTLLEKYKNLVEENRSLKEGTYSSLNNSGVSAPQISVPNQNGQNSKEVKLEINESDFQSNQQNKIVIDTNTDPKSIISTQKYQEDLIKFAKAYDFFEQKDYSKSIKLFQELEASQNLQVKVRAKLYSGRILFMQQEYDLALQVFEEILGQMAYSSVVIDALGFAYYCSDKLKLEDKKNKYKSLLQDVFKQSV